MKTRGRVFCTPYLASYHTVCNCTGRVNVGIFVFSGGSSHHKVLQVCYYQVHLHFHLHLVLDLSPRTSSSAYSRRPSSGGGRTSLWSPPGVSSTSCHPPSGWCRWWGSLFYPAARLHQCWSASTENIRPQWEFCAPLVLYGNACLKQKLPHFW